MAKKGKNIYCPPEVLALIEKIKREDNLSVGTEAMRHMVHYANEGKRQQQIIKEEKPRLKKGRMIGFI